ncbi:MAG TPA: hypothetical protein VF069_29030 [Streptosporangiaceae bacterium]
MPEEPSAPGWHPFHYPVGIFLVAYGTAGIPLLAVGWADRHREMATYLAKTVDRAVALGPGIATPALIAIKVMEALLTLLALAGLLRRRDVWYLPALLGWIAGFAALCVLDVWSGRFGGFAEHAVYLLGFAVLLAASFVLGVKARVAGFDHGRRPPAGSPRLGGRGAAGTPLRLTRTQERALAAINRWRRPPAGR